MKLPLSAPTVPDLRGCRVLVVDDNVDAAHMLEVVLTGAGCEVRCAYDGLSAPGLAEEFGPEIVVLDLALPDIDGYEVLQRLRASSRIRPGVIALTGFGQPADLERMQQAGFDLSLRKPAALNTLEAAIQWVRRSKAKPGPAQSES